MLSPRCPNRIHPMAQTKQTNNPTGVEVRCILSDLRVETRSSEDGKFVFGQTVEIYYERRYWLDDNKERFEISVGSTGSFDLCKNEVSDRAMFYMDFGKLLSDTALLGDLKNMLFDYADTMEAIHDRLEKLQKSLENPLA